MFPPELIDRFVDEVAIGIEKSSHYIPENIGNNLRSCSLAARCFRLQSQRHLLSHASLSIAHGETQSEKVQRLREILETNGALRQCIIHLSIDFRATEPLDIDDGDVDWEFHDENLPSVINMLTEMRQLKISCTNLYAMEWDRLSEGIKTALRNTRFTSPHLSILSLYGISISPYEFIDTWKSIKNITLRNVEMDMDEDTSQDASMLEYRLERVTISGHEFPLHLVLQNSQILGGLRQFRIDGFRVCPDNIRQIWNVIHIASESLKDLGLPACFVTSIRPRFMTMDHFPSLRRLKISDNIIGEKAFLDSVYPFFKLVNPTSTSKLQNLALDLVWIMPIGSNASYEDEVLLPLNGWHQLDALLTSSQYPSLRKVYIAICFSASWHLRLDEPERHSRLWHIYRHVKSFLFPLLSSSDSIELEFHPRTGYHPGF